MENDECVSPMRKTVSDGDSKLKILIVEDSQMFRVMLGQILNKDYECYNAVNGQEGMSLFKKHSPEIVFLDINLPDISGHEVLKSIKDLEPEAFIIMVTGDNEKGTVKKTVENGADGYVIKPYAPKQIQSYIDKYLQNKEPE